MRIMKGKSEKWFLRKPQFKGDLFHWDICWLNYYFVVYWEKEKRFFSKYVFQVICYLFGHKTESETEKYTGDLGITCKRCNLYKSPYGYSWKIGSNWGKAEPLREFESKGVNE